MLNFLLSSTRCRAGVAFVLLATAAGWSAAAAQATPPAGMTAAEAEALRQLVQSGLTPAQAQARLAQQKQPPAARPDPATSQTSAADSARLVRNIRTWQDSVLLDSLRMAIGNEAVRGQLMAFLRTPSMRSTAIDEGFAIFGESVFRRPDGSAPEVNLLGPVDDAYRLGPGDDLLVTLTGDVERSIPVTVSREGYISFENLGPPLLVAGLTKREAEAQIFSRLSRAHSTLRRDNSGTLQMMFSVVRQGMKGVRVMGDVTTPGEYVVPNSATIIAALYRAGGPTDRGSYRGIQLKRGNQTVSTLDLYNYLVKGNTAEDFRVESGDVIFVPPRGERVRLAGNVLRPATYEIKSSETLRDLIAMAGGFSATADLRRIQIERILPPGDRREEGRDRQVYDVMDPGLAAGTVPPTPLEAGDVVTVREIAGRVGGQVLVKGNVWSSGSVAFRPGMQLSEAIARAGGLKSDSYLDQVNIARLQPNMTRTLLRAALRDTLGTPVQDLPLEEGDEIEIFSVSSFRPARYVDIAGEVRTPGRYPYREGMTARDLTLLAGGVLESALLTNAELSRLPEDRSRGTLAVTTPFPLDSLYHFERGPDGKYLGPPGIQGASRSPEVSLKPYDHVLILRQPDWSYQQIVTVAGEVVLPGEYTLRSKDERVSDIIQRAGGLTRDAYANGVEFVRAADGLGRVGVDLPAVLADPRHRDNLLLVNGDRISIPRFSAVINVQGDVNSPVAVSYVPGADIDYYIRAAGRGRPTADEGRAYVRQPNGKVESKRRQMLVHHVTPVPQPGSTVFVPAKDEGRDWLAATNSTLTTTLSLIGSLVALAAVLR